MRKIKVLVLIDTLGRGGAEGQVYELVKNLDKARYEPVVCSLTNQGEYIDEITDEGVRVITLAGSLRNVPWSVHKLVSLVRKERFDVVQNVMFTAGLIGTVVARLLHVPVIINSVRSLGFTSRRYRRIIKYFIYKLSDCVIVNCKNTKSLLVSHRIVETDKVRIIYNGVNLERFHPESNGFRLSSKRKELGLQSKAFPIIGMLAKLSPVKNHQCLLKAIPTIRKEFPNAVFLIIGNGPLRRDLEKSVANLDVNEKVLFLGPRKDTPELLRLMDLSVLCSFREGFSNAILESMASGKPVIATNVGGNPEAIGEGKGGFLFDADDSEMLGQRVREVLRDRNVASQMGLAARRRAEDLFSVRKMVDEYDGLYQSLLRKKGLCLS